VRELLGTLPHSVLVLRALRIDKPVEWVCAGASFLTGAGRFESAGQSENLTSLTAPSAASG